MKTLALGFFLGAITVGVILGAASPAHADPNTSFLDCLAQEGLIITNPAEATRYAALIDQDARNNIPIGVTTRALIQKGFDPLKAGAYVACAARVRMGMPPSVRVSSQDTSVDDLFSDEDYNLNPPLIPASGPSTVETPGTSGVGVIA
jgi:hypothetical protein